MIHLTGHFTNGKPFTRNEPTRYDAQASVDFWAMNGDITMEEWSRLTDWLSEPEVEQRYDENPPSRDPSRSVPAAEWGTG